MMATHLVPVAHELTEAEYRRHLRKDLLEILEDQEPLGSTHTLLRFHCESHIKILAILLCLEGLRPDLIAWLEESV